MANFMKVDKKDVKGVIGGILGGEEERELCLVRSYNKFVNLKNNAERYRGVFELLSRIRTFDKYPKEKSLLINYIDIINKDLDEYFNKAPLVQHLIEMHPLIPKDKQEESLEFLRYYNKAKKAPIIHTIINTCGNLVPYKTYLTDKDNLDDKFMTKTSMLTFEPVVDLDINFKLIYISDLLDKNEKKLILLSLHKIYTISVDMYDEFSKVDIDTDQFVRAVYMTVDKLKKQIPRCEEAFQKILDSTDLLRNNYGDYYKDYVGSQNSMIIAENFIQDVAGTVDRSPKLALQFRKIIQHLRDMTNKLIAKDPRYKDTFGSLLDHADNSYAEIKKGLEEEGEVMEEEEDDEEDDGIKKAFEQMTDTLINNSTTKSDPTDEEKVSTQEESDKLFNAINQMTKMLVPEEVQHIDPNIENRDVVNPNTEKDNV